MRLNYEASRAGGRTPSAGGRPGDSRKCAGIRWRLCSSSGRAGDNMKHCSRSWVAGPPPGIECNPARPGGGDGRLRCTRARVERDAAGCSAPARLQSLPSVIDRIADFPLHVPSKTAAAPHARPSARFIFGLDVGDVQWPVEVERGAGARGRLWTY